MPIFSLYSNYGIGSFGKEAYNFIDFLRGAGQSAWQILPLTQTGFGNSPYSSVCSYSFNPYFISVERLFDLGLISDAQLKGAVDNSKYINYDKLSNERFTLLRQAFANFDKTDKDFSKFIKKGEFHDYALFMAIKSTNFNKPFYDWIDGLKNRDTKALEKFEKDNLDEVLFWQFIQFEAEREWISLKKYANEKGISIIGDMPLYMALDSVDVWANKTLFKLDQNFAPKKVAGVPPDYFSKTGQLWGNPVYDYDEHKKDGFAWWQNRVKRALSVYDYVRIDHFRGLDRYYEIPCTAKDAVVGEWIDVPSDDLFNAIHKVVDKERIIAEDLGLIDDGVINLMQKLNYPGMKVLSFAFNGGKDNHYLPENINENSVCYTGTHDNDTLKGYIDSLSEWEYDHVKNNIMDSLKSQNVKIKIKERKDTVNAIIELGFKSKSKLFIIPLFDLRKCDTKYRINEPGIVKDQNWSVRARQGFTCSRTVKRLRTLTEKYDRLNKKND